MYFYGNLGTESSSAASVPAGFPSTGPMMGFPTGSLIPFRGMDHTTANWSAAISEPTRETLEEDEAQESEERNTSHSFTPESLRRKRVCDMSPDERLEWSRMQSRDHSRKSRQRRKQIEQDLREEIDQLQSFRTLIEDSFQLVSIQSLDDCAKFLYANSVFYRALNYIPQELIGVPFQELAIPEHRSILNEAIGLVLEENGV
jgi:PAS domain-containing protein